VNQSKSEENTCTRRQTRETRVSQPQFVLLLRLIDREIGRVSKPITVRYKSRPTRMRTTFDAQVKILFSGLNVSCLVVVYLQKQAKGKKLRAIATKIKSSRRGWGK